MRKLLTVAVCVVLGALGIAPAYANHNPPLLDITEPGECGAVTFSLSQPDGTHKVANVRLVVEADGEVKTGAVGQPVTVGPFASNAESVTIHYRVFGGGERDYDAPLWNGYGDADFKDDVNDYGTTHGWGWAVAGTGDSNPFVTWDTLTVTPCPVVTTEAPTTTGRTCDAPGFITLPDVEGVEKYTVNGDPHEAGEFAAAPGKYHVKAHLADGYVLADGSVTSWKVTVEAELEACPGKPGRDGEDGEDGRDGEDGADGEKPTKAAPVPTTIPAGLTGELPKTGPSMWLLGLVGLAAVALGGYLMYATRPARGRHSLPR